MVPRTIRQQLHRLRTREYWLQLVWRIARWLPLLVGVLVVACVIDWLIDLRRDTPLALRVVLLLGQLLLWSAVITLVGGALSRRYSDTEVALWVEDKVPHLGHRLISAVQLNQPDADTKGMSPELIAAVTREAEGQVATLNLSQLADSRRLLWSAVLLVPLALGVVLLVFGSETVRVLLARQLLANRDIPRSVALECVNPQVVWPAGEEVVLRFWAAGDPVNDDLKGEVRIDPEGARPSEPYDLIFESKDDTGVATYVARIPASSTDYLCHAWLKDGRTHQPARVHFEPRPVVQRIEAWIQMPEYIGLRASGQPFEEPQKGADIIHRFPKSTARVAIEVQKPIARAALEILGLADDAETVRRTVDLTVQDDGYTAEGVFDLDQKATEIGYRIRVRDRYGFENVDRPRRGIRTGPLDPPLVTFLPEHFWKQGDEGPPEDREVEGIPVLLGQRIQLGYRCASPYGLSHARLRYRVVRKSVTNDGESAPAQEADFLPLPLGAPRGATGTISKKALEEFFTLPSPDPDKVNGTEGGGRYDLDSMGIPDGKGGLLQLKEGDRVQFYVEVFGRADPDGQPGRTVMREKEVVGLKDFLAWLDKKEDQKEKIRQLEEKQRGAASRTVPSKPDRPPGSGTTGSPSQPSVLADAVFGRSWQLLGVFPNVKNMGHTRVYTPEAKGPADLSKEHTGLKGKIAWQPYHSPTDKIDLKKFFSHGDAGVAYAVCWINCGKRSTVLATGSDDGIKVWIDKKLVLDKTGPREAIRGEDKTRIELEDGWHEVLVKVDNNFDTWAFYLELLDPTTGNPLEGVSVRITPP